MNDGSKEGWMDQTMGNDEQQMNDGGGRIKEQRGGGVDEEGSMNDE